MTTCFRKIIKCQISQKVSVSRIPCSSCASHIPTLFKKYASFSGQPKNPIPVEYVKKKVVCMGWGIFKDPHISKNKAVLLAMISNCSFSRCWLESHELQLELKVTILPMVHPICDISVYANLSYKWPCKLRQYPNPTYLYHFPINLNKMLSFCTFRFPSLLFSLLSNISRLIVLFVCCDFTRKL